MICLMHYFDSRLNNSYPVGSSDCDRRYHLSGSGIMITRSSQLFESGLHQVDELTRYYIILGHSSTQLLSTGASYISTLSDELRNPDLHSATFRRNLKTFLF